MIATSDKKVVTEMRPSHLSLKRVRIFLCRHKGHSRKGRFRHQTESAFHASTAATPLIMIKLTILLRIEN